MNASDLYTEILDYLAANGGLEDFDDESEDISDYYGNGEGQTGWYDLIEAFPWRNDVEKIVQLSSGKLEILDHRSGGEEEGTVMWLVLKFTDNNGNEQFFKKDGWYQSFHGGEWEGDFREVKATTREVVFYE